MTHFDTLKLSIYEAYDAGDITESEKEFLMTSLEAYGCVTESFAIKTKEYRMVVGEHDGHLYKVTFKLNPKNITSVNEDRGKEKEKLQKMIRLTGHSNYTSAGNEILSITDMCTNKKVNSVSAYPPIHNSGGDIMPIRISEWKTLMKDFLKEEELEKKEEQLKKECPTGIVPNPNFKNGIKRSKANGQEAIKYTVGQIDPTDTYKTTNVKKVTKGMLKL